MSFASIPIRVNGQRIEASWFNTIRTQLINLLGDIQGQTAQNIDNAVTSQDVSTLSFSSQDFSSIDVEYTIRRKTDSGEKFVRGEFSLQYLKNTDSWRLEEGEFRGDDAGVTFDLLEDTVGGFRTVQVRYTSDSLAGANYEGFIITTTKGWGVI